MSAFFGELEKVARDLNSAWATKTIGAPRSKLPPIQLAKAPTAPGPMSPKLVMPAAKNGPRQTYSQPNVESPPEFNPAQSSDARQTPPPSVSFGV